MTIGSIDRRGFAALLAGAFLSGSSFAARAQGADPAVALVNGLYDGVKAASAATTVEARVGALGEAFGRAFDYPAMLRLAYGGARWNRVPEAKQAALVEGFTRFFNVTYANRLSAAQGSTFEVQPASEARGEGRLVRSKVTAPQGNVTNVDYVVGKEGKVSDVLLAGTVSEVGNLRTEFDAPIKAGGADRLEAYMRQRVEAMLAAKPAAG